MIRKLLAKRRDRRRKLKASRVDKRAARREVERLREALRAAIGKEARQEATDELLRARHELDRLEDQVRARRARVARATKRIKASRSDRQGEVISRAEWGAAPPRGSFIRQVAELIARVQHHTANPALPDTASVAEESARMRQIQAGHFARGFTDIGYASVTFPSGRTYEGRDPGAVGAHTDGHNTGYLGTAYDANCDVTAPTVKGLAALRANWARLGVAGLRIFGHYELSPSLCPGAKLKPRVQSL